MRDIQEEMVMYHNVGRTLGDECDEKEWQELYRLLREEAGKSGTNRNTK